MDEVKQEFQYFYIVFTLGGGIWCSTVLKQHPGPNGFNFANCHGYLMGLYQMNLVITQYYEINERRYNEFKTFLAKRQGEGKPALTVHQGGGEAAPKAPGEVRPLRPVPAPEAPVSVEEKKEPEHGPENSGGAAASGFCLDKNGQDGRDQKSDRHLEDESKKPE